MRLAIFQDNGLIYQRIIRFLRQNSYSVDTVNRVTSHTIKNYDVVVFTEGVQVPNLVKVIEQIALEEAILVVYIHQGSALNQFYNIASHPFFIDITLKDLHLEWRYKIPLATKYSKVLTRSYQALKETKKQLNALENELKAKRILMRNGLSEAESHRFIQQKAMKLRKSKQDVVNLIIQNKIDFNT